MMKRQGAVGIPHPIPYQGSKRALAPVIIGYFPADAERLIEPFAGSAAVSLAASHYRKVRRFLINDINQALVNLWDQIIHKPEEIISSYERLWQVQQGQERHFYDVVRAEFNKTQRPDYFLYLLARCVKASVRYNPDGEFNQSPDNRRKGAHPSAMRARVMGASRLLNGKTELACADYKQVLSEATPSDIVYMDPPYAGVCSGKDRRYLGALSFDTKEFVNELYTLNARGISFILSYDGRTGEKTFGHLLPASLDLTRLEVNAGRSSQATLLGRVAETVESLYLSPALMNRIRHLLTSSHREQPLQYPLFAAAS